MWAWFAQRARFSFEKRQDDERRVAQQALELLKTQLTFDAEVRRHVAAKKVEALLAIADVTRTSVECVYGLSTDDQTARQAAIKDYWAALRDGLVLFENDVVEEVKAFGTELTNAHVARSRKDPGAPDLAGVVDRGIAARDKLFEVIRRELRIVSPEPKDFRATGG